MNQQNISPTPTQDAVIMLDFPSAMKEIIEGKKVTKLEWEDENAYGILRDGFLMLYKKNEQDYKDYQWIISDGDLKGEDYIVIN